VPRPRSLLRLLALAAFILTVALALWLLEAEWPVVVLVMALAWVFAATFEWAAWRQERPGSLSAPSEPAAPAEPVVPSTPAPEAAPLPSPLLVAPPERSPEDAETPPEEAEEQARPAAPPQPSERPPLRPVPTPPPSPAPSTTPPPAAARPARSSASSGVVDLRTRATVQPRHWNLWDLERLAREELHGDPLRLEALSYLFVHLRQFATPDGSLPTEFDGLVRESFGDLLEQRR
jgi:outer membrane biosynthesis protein TonB